MKVKLTKQKHFQGHRLSLVKNREYLVIGIEADDYRIMASENDIKPYLYDKSYFDITDNSKPNFWVCSKEDGLNYCYPPEWNYPGFFEDIHDERKKTLIIFKEGLKKYYGIEL